MQTRTVVVALDIRDSKPGYRFFERMTFDDKLQFLSEKIIAACEELAIREPDAKEWIISWREYGLFNEYMRYVSVDQRKQLKKAMAELTAKYEKLTIISGTVASARPISQLSRIKRSRQYRSVIDAYQENADRQGSSEFVEHRAQSFKVIDNQIASPDAARRPAVIIRNTSYVFKGGKCIARHDKTAPFEETTGLDKEGAMFRPGRGRSHPSVVNDQFAIEICKEHDDGCLAAQMKSGTKTLPKMQFVISDSIPLAPWHQVCPYLIHIDSVEEVSLTTVIDPAEAEVCLYRSDVLEFNSQLKPVAPVNPRVVMFEKIRRCIDDNIVPPLEEHLKNKYMTANDCEEILYLLVEMSLKKGIDKALAKDNHRGLDYIATEVEAIIDYLKDNKLGINPRLFMLCAAAFSGSHVVVSFMQHIDFSKPHSSDTMLLFLAAAGSHSGLLSKLLPRLGANHRLADGRTPLMLALEYNATAAIKKLLGCHGIHIDDEEYEALINLVMRDTALVKQLTTFKDETLLHLAADRDDFVNAVHLLNNGVNINQRNADGHTALYLAAARGNSVLVTLLLNAGADPFIRAIDGSTAIDAAIRFDENDPSVSILLTKQKQIITAQYERLKILYKALSDPDIVSTPLVSGLIALIHKALQSNNDPRHLHELFELAQQAKCDMKIFQSPETEVTRLYKIIRLIEKNTASTEDFKRLVYNYIDELKSPAPARKNDGTSSSHK